MSQLRVTEHNYKGQNFSYICFNSFLFKKSFSILVTFIGQLSYAHNII